MCERILEVGKKPVWVHSISNTGSKNTAQKCGVQENTGGCYQEISLTFRFLYDRFHGDKTKKGTRCVWAKEWRLDNLIW
jgi:hypothetical protein